MSSNNNRESKDKPKCNCLGDLVRKFAFNLGIRRGGASQTDVKIISCIPIDVTELQQKILSLERQLEEKKFKNISVHTALCSPQFQPTALTLLSQSSDQIPKYDAVTNVQNMQCTHDADRIDRSTESLLTPPMNTPIQQNYRCSTIPEEDNRPNSNYNVLKSACIDYIYSKYNKNNIENIKHRRSKKEKEKDTIFKKKNNVQTHLVYYTQTTSSPFSKRKTAKEFVDKANECNAMSRVYLENMIRKQYKPKPILCSSTSEFSSPICRDLEKCHIACTYDPDVCSCCRGMFRNIDHELTAQHRNRLRNAAVGTISPTRCARNDYYNSNYYDVVPVKEKEVKHKSTKRKFRDTIGVKYCSDKNRPKSLDQNLNDITAIQLIRKSFPIDRKDKLINKVHSTRRDRLKYKFNAETGIPKTQNERENDLKKLRYTSASNFVTPKLVTPVILHRNAACLTYEVNNMECQTITSENLRLKLPPSNDNKTEATLNQIKTILLSVLTEVKTNNPIRRTPSEKLFRDAFVQKDLSQNTIQNSSKLIQSYTYSPYNLTLNGMNTYLHQLPSSSLCCPTVPYPQLRYVQNYPVLIQTQKKISNCFRQPQVTRSVCTINATDVTTNTDSETNNCNKNNETKKLVKSIDESIAVNVEIQTKKASNTEHKETTSNIADKCEIKNETNEIPKALSNSNYSKHIEEMASVHSQMNINKTNNSNNAYRVSSFTGTSSEKNKNSLETTTEIQKDDVTLTYTESSDSDTDMRDVQSLAQSMKIVKKQEKMGLLKKMFKSVNLFKFKNQNTNDSNTESEETDSTIDYHYGSYSKKKLKCNTEAGESRKYITSKRLDAYDNQKSAGQLIKSPYLEKEYKRSWEKNLIFHNDTTRGRLSNIRAPKLLKRPALPGSQNSKNRRNSGARTTTVNHRTGRLDTIRNKRVSFSTKPAFKGARSVKPR